MVLDGLLAGCPFICPTGLNIPTFDLVSNCNKITLSSPHITSFTIKHNLLVTGEVGNWGPGVGIGEGSGVRNESSPYWIKTCVWFVHTVLQWLWYKYQQTSFKSWISRCPWKMQDPWVVFPQSAHQLELSTPWGAHSLQSSESHRLGHHINLPPVLNWGFNAQQKAFSQLSGPRETLKNWETLPPTERKLEDQVAIFDLLSEPWGAQGSPEHPPPSFSLLSHSASRFSLWLWVQGRWELESSRGRDTPGQKARMAGREENSDWGTDITFTLATSVLSRPAPPLHHGHQTQCWSDIHHSYSHVNKDGEWSGCLISSSWSS